MVKGHRCKPSRLDNLKVELVPQDQCCLFESGALYRLWSGQPHGTALFVRLYGQTLTPMSVPSPLIFGRSRPSGSLRASYTSPDSFPTPKK